MNNFSKRWRGLGSVIAVLVILMVICSSVGGCGSKSGTSTNTGGTPKSGGTYNYPLAINPFSIEPLNAQESEGQQVAHQIFQGLMTYVLQPDGSMKVVPNLAESANPYEANADATVFTFHLRHGVKFQAPVSREVTAQDFVDSWSRVTDSSNQSAVSYVLAPIQGVDDSGYAAKGLTGVKAIDKYTLQVKLRYPFAEFPQTLGHPVASVTPVDYINEIGQKAFAAKPVGTGPYMLKSWIPNQRITLVKNPNYWDKAANAGPYIDTINMPIITLVDTRWLEFQKGDLDYAPVPPGSVAKALADPKVKSGVWTARKWASLSVEYVGINMDDPVLGQNLELRQALAYAADAEHVISVVNENVSTLATGIVPLGVPGYRAKQSPYAYDLDKAKKLVQAMSPSPTTINLWYYDNDIDPKIATVLQAGWEQAGLKVKLNKFEVGVFLDKLSKGNAGSGSQLFLFAWLADYPSMDGFLYPLFQTEAYPSIFYKNSQFDQLLATARQTIDATQRQNLYAQAEKLMLTDAPAIPLYYDTDFRVTNNRVQNFARNPMGFTDMWTLWIK